MDKQLNAPNELRFFLGKMRTAQKLAESRKLIKEEIGEEEPLTDIEQKTEQDKFRDAVHISTTFSNISAKGNEVVWSGNIMKLLDWFYTVSVDETLNKCEIRISKEDGVLIMNDELVEVIKNLYFYFDNEFSTYWLENKLLNK
jgi:hypothetical protein